MGTFEYVGILLIIIGVIYIFLQGMGKLSDKGGEIETKILSLKGGAGLILVALGIVLLAMGGGIQLPAGISEKLPSTEEVKTELGFKPTPTKTVVSAPTSTPTSQPLAGKVSPTSTAAPASKSMVLKPIDKESGTLDSKGGSWLSYHEAGDWKNLALQDFLSFNIASIPANATLTSATLDISAYSRKGDPFSYLGCLGAYEYDFGAADPSDFFYGTPQNAIAKWCTYGDLSSSLPSNDLMSAIQRKLGKDRFQIRLQFDKATDNNDQDDYLDFNPRNLIVAYTVS